MKECDQVANVSVNKAFCSQFVVSGHVHKDIFSFLYP